MSERAKRTYTTKQPTEGVSMTARSAGRVFVEIRMELPLALGIELVTAAAQVQGKSGPAGAGTDGANDDGRQAA